LKTKNKFVIICISFILITVGLSGCNEETGKDDDKPVTVANYTILSDIDGEVLDSAYEDYNVLRQTISAEDARNQLVDDLNSTEGVDNAKLGLDGYTIFVTFSDGDLAAVDTFELDEDLPPTGGLQSISASKKSLPVTNNLIVVGPLEKTTSEKKELLVLGPCYWEFDKTYVDQCIDQFKTYGWTEDDIDLKLVKKAPYQTGSNWNEFTPEDFFDLEDYGIVLFTGHGTVKVKDNYDEDNLFLQFCYLNNASFVNDKRFQEWEDNGELITTDRSIVDLGGGKTEYVYGSIIRADVLRKELSTIPSSILHFSTCFGGHMNDVFLDAGAKIFLGWNKQVKANIGDKNMLNMVRLMLENDFCVYDAYSDSSIVKSYDSIDSNNQQKNVNVLPGPDTEIVYDTRFDIYPPLADDRISASYYLPAWINLEVSNIPKNTYSIRVSVYDEDSALLNFDDEDINYGDTTAEIKDAGGAYFPANEGYTIKATALDSDKEEISSGETTATLETGDNIVQVEIMEIGDVSIVFNYPYENGQLDVLKDRYLSMDARVENRPSGEFLNVWDNLGDASLGGFGLQKLQHYETDDIDVFFYPNGVGTDGEQIPISLSIYHVVGDDKELLGTATASIDVYNPTTRYEIVDQNDEKRFMGSGSMWSFYNVGHGSIFSSGFYARSGDQIRVHCRDKGYIPDWESYQVYLKGPAGKQLLFDISDPELPESVEEDAYDKTFTV